MTFVMLLFTTAAVAEGPGFGVEISAETTDAEAADGCAVFNANITNTGSAPTAAQVTLSADAGDSGWTVDPTPPNQVQVAAGATEEVSFGLCPPADAEDGAMATVTLNAEVTNDPSTDKAQDSQDFGARYVATEDTLGNDTFGNDTDEDVGQGIGDDNETGGGGASGESPGPGAVLVAVAALAVVALRRRA